MLDVIVDGASSPSPNPRRLSSVLMDKPDTMLIAWRLDPHKCRHALSPLATESLNGSAKT